MHRMEQYKSSCIRSVGGKKSIFLALENLFAVGKLPNMGRLSVLKVKISRPIGENHYFKLEMTA